MKFLKFCIDTDLVDKHISDDMDVKDKIDRLNRNSGE